jgi:hypothetical protein
VALFVPVPGLLIRPEIGPLQLTYVQVSPGFVVMAAHGGRSAASLPLPLLPPDPVTDPHGSAHVSVCPHIFTHL